MRSGACYRQARFRSATLQFVSKHVIAVIGAAASGKGEVVSALQAQGFQVLSLSDILRTICAQIDLEPTRENLIALGNSLRAAFGPDILARGVKLQLAKVPSPGLVIESIRHPAEVAYLKKELGALVIGITIAPEKQFELMQARGRVGDPQTWPEFEAFHQTEIGTHLDEQSTDISVGRALALADELIPNQGTREQLAQQVAKVLKQHGLS